MTFWHVKLIDVEGSGCWQLKYWFYYYYWRSKPTLIKPSLGRRTRTHTHTHIQYNNGCHEHTPTAKCSFFYLLNNIHTHS